MKETIQINWTNSEARIVSRMLLLIEWLENGREMELEKRLKGEKFIVGVCFLHFVLSFSSISRGKKNRRT